MALGKPNVLQLSHSPAVHFALQLGLASRSCLEPVFRCKHRTRMSHMSMFVLPLADQTSLPRLRADKVQRRSTT